MKKFRHIAGAVVLAIGLAISPIATAIGPATETVYAEAPEWAKLTITVPSTITHPNSDGEYVIPYTVNHEKELVGVRMVKGKVGMEAWDSGTPVSESGNFVIPQPPE